MASGTVSTKTPCTRIGTETYDFAKDDRAMFSQCGRLSFLSLTHSPKQLPKTLSMCLASGVRSLLLIMCTDAPEPTINSLSS